MAPRSADKRATDAHCALNQAVLADLLAEHPLPRVNRTPSVKTGVIAGLDTRDTILWTVKLRNGTVKR